MDIGVLKRSDGSGGQLAKMEIVPATDKRAPLRSLGAPGCESSQTGAARIIGVVAAVNGCVEVNPMAKPGCVQSASSAIDIDIATGAERSPGMRVLAHGADGQLVGYSIIDTQADSTSREIITLSISVAVHIDKVTESGHPHSPTIFRRVLKYRFHDCFGGFPIRVGPVFQIHRGAVHLHVGAEPVGSVVDVVHPAFQI